MKKFMTLFFLLVCTISFAQDISGPWYGQLAIPGGKLRIILNITKTATGYSATMDSPDQGAKDIPVPSVAFENNLFVFAIPDARIEYKGTLENNVIKGSFSQNSNILPLDFGREELKAATKPLRPQEPVKPYPYLAEEVSFKNEKAGNTLSGTLTVPKKEGTFPAVILVTGSGAQNRDEELLGHKPFLVLADFLTKNGIAVLRYDDRGVGGSTGDFENSTTKDFATDADAAFQYLKTRKEINKNKIGIIGHSEGGIIAPIVASQNPDVAFIVLMAGAAIPGDELMMLQNYMIGKVNGMPEEELTKLGNINRQTYDIIKQETDLTVMRNKLQESFNKEMKPLLISKGIPQADVTQYLATQASELASPWYSNFIKYNPAADLEKVKCPILAINGSKDLQVSPMANLAAIKRAGEKSGNKKVTVKELPGLNHLFQESTTGSPTDYNTIEQTISPVALNEISSWITKQVK
ncbi:Alpha/beta hydrolase family protein [compost metagenome]